MAGLCPGYTLNASSFGNKNSMQEKKEIKSTYSSRKKLKPR